MNYGNKWASSPEEAQLQALGHIIDILEKMDKKLFVVIKKLEESGEVSAFPDRESTRANVRAVLEGESKIRQLEDMT